MQPTIQDVINQHNEGDNNKKKKIIIVVTSVVAVLLVTGMIIFFTISSLNNKTATDDTKAQVQYTKQEIDDIHLEATKNINIDPAKSKELLLDALEKYKAINDQDSINDVSAQLQYLESIQKN